MASRVLAVLLVLLFVACPAASAAVTSSPADTGYAAQTTPTETPVVENTTLALQLQSDGDARWRITDTYALEDGNDTRAFEELADEFTQNNTDLGWEQAFRDASARAGASTGREMVITDVTRNATTTDRRGQLVLEFTWTNFATANGSRLLVQDGFNTTNGTWLPRLYDNQTLVISPPPGYGVTSAPPTQINDGAVILRGPQTFEPGYIDIVYRGDQPTATPTQTTPGPTTSGDIPWLGGALVLVVALAVAAAYINRQDDTPSVGASATGPDDGGDDPDAGSEPHDTDSDDDIDVALLSDEERVERLLEENGGRMKQARIVSETGWSNAKVSQLLSSMDEAGRIDKLRIGRENLISFPDEDVTEIED